MSRICSLAALIAAGWLACAAAPAAAAATAGELDDAEAGICMAHNRLRGTIDAREKSRGQSVPADQLTGRRLDDPISRARLQHEVDVQLAAAQDALVEDARRDLARRQADYRRLTGSEFATSDCNGPRPRFARAMLEQQRRDAQMAAQTSRMKRELEAGDQAREAAVALDSACNARRALALPPDAAARLFPAGTLAKMRDDYETYATAYRRTHGREFAGAECR